MQRNQSLRGNHRRVDGPVLMKFPVFFPANGISTTETSSSKTGCTARFFHSLSVIYDDWAGTRKSPRIGALFRLGRAGGVGRWRRLALAVFSLSSPSRIRHSHPIWGASEFEQSTRLSFVNGSRRLRAMLSKPGAASAVRSDASHTTPHQPAGCATAARASSIYN